MDPSGWAGNDWSEKAMVEDKIDEWRRSKVAPSDQPAEPDFFNDMAPEIKKPKKVSHFTFFLHRLL